MNPSVHDVRRALARPPVRLPLDGAGRAAVAAILIPDPAGGCELLFMRRADRAGDPWSGHLAFPGGHVDPSDTGPLAAAIRETHEELGLTLGPEQLVGELDELRTVSALPSLVIRPFVFAVDELPKLDTNHEVASVHRRSLGALLMNHGRGRFPLDWRGRRVELPCVDFGGVRLWGLTLSIVDDLLHRLDSGGVGLARGARQAG